MREQGKRYQEIWENGKFKAVFRAAYFFMPIEQYLPDKQTARPFAPKNGAQDDKT